ncbi:MAG: phytanoyl-CoA dioxygenase [Rhodospirillaceae bacterium]|nr:MAG: phytanoyl-CoA dioxygenase [Rhodospirillaceae bacterium]
MLTKQQISDFRSNGVLVIEQLITEGAIQKLRHRVGAHSGRPESLFPETIWSSNRGKGKGHGLSIDYLRKFINCAKNDDVFMEHAKSPMLLDVIESLLGPDIKLLTDQLFIKPPGGMEKTYHQDSPYFPIRPMELVSSWTALDDVTLDNGCLWVVPGSHLGGALPHSEVWMRGDREDMRVPDQIIDREVEQPILLKAGDVSFHHGLLLHRSGPNRTSTRRRGLATHYMRPSRVGLARNYLSLLIPFFAGRVTKVAFEIGAMS